MSADVTGGGSLSKKAIVFFAVATVIVRPPLYACLVLFPFPSLALSVGVVVHIQLLYASLTISSRRCRGTRAMGALAGGSEFAALCALYFVTVHLGDFAQTALAREHMGRGLMGLIIFVFAANLLPILSSIKHQTEDKWRRRKNRANSAIKAKKDLEQAEREKAFDTQLKLEVAEAEAEVEAKLEADADATQVPAPAGLGIIEEEPPRKPASKVKRPATPRPKPRKVVN